MRLNIRECFYKLYTLCRLLIFIMWGLKMLQIFPLKPLMSLSKLCHVVLQSHVALKERSEGTQHLGNRNLKVCLFSTV